MLKFTHPPVTFARLIFAKRKFKVKLKFKFGSFAP